MTISFIVPLYKGKIFLPKILANIENISKNIKKNFEYNVELVLVNDDSESRVDEIDTNIYIDHIVVYNSKVNKGIHASRIKGLDLSSGEYICFLDQDDYIYEKFGSKMLSKAIENDSDVVLCNGIYRDNRKIYNNISEIYIAISKKYFSSLTAIISPGQTLIRRDVIPLEWKNHILKFNYCDDAFLWCLLKDRDVKFEYVDEVLYVHKEDGKNQSFNWWNNVEALEELKMIIVSKKLLHNENMQAFLSTISIEIAKNKCYANIERKLDYYRKNIEEFKKIISEKSNNIIVVYGVGIIGRSFIKLLKQTGIKNYIAIDKSVKYFDDIKIYSLYEYDKLSELVDKEKCCVCVTVGNDYSQIRKRLLRYGFKNIYLLDEFLSN